MAPYSMEQWRRDCEAAAVIVVWLAGWAFGLWVVGLILRKVWSWPG